VRPLASQMLNLLVIAIDKLLYCNGYLQLWYVQISCM